MADDADIAVAKAQDLWDVLTTTDQVGNVVNEIRTEDANGKHGFRNALQNAFELTGKDNIVKDITRAEFEDTKYGGPGMTAPPKFVARGVGALNVAQFGVDLVQQGWKEATFNLVDPTGIGHQHLEMLRQCDNGGCIA